MTAKKQAKMIEDMVDASFKKNGNRIEFNIFDLGKIHKAGVAAAATGHTQEEVARNIDEAVIAAIAVYRKN